VIYVFDLAAGLADYDHMDDASRKSLQSQASQALVSHKNLETAFEDLFRPTVKSASA
jgi:hypothetical protein